MEFSTALIIRHGKRGAQLDPPESEPDSHRLPVALGQSPTFASWKQIRSLLGALLPRPVDPESKVVSGDEERREIPLGVPLDAPANCDNDPDLLIRNLDPRNGLYNGIALRDDKEEPALTSEVSPRPLSPVQNHGSEFQCDNSQTPQLHLQSSQCDGKKRALFIGINYLGQANELKGCINDVENIQNFIIREYGYKKEDMTTLTDDASDPRQSPTRENIIQAMKWLVDKAQPGDSLFFHYSGHGGQIEDSNGDEDDGCDEDIYPVDYETNNCIVDDEMFTIMVKPLPPGCRLTAIFDSCHSGSALDLPNIYSPVERKIVFKEPNLTAEAEQSIPSTASYAPGNMSDVRDSERKLVKRLPRNTRKAEKLPKEAKTIQANVISLSGCMDSQTSADTQEAGKAGGAMSFAFLRALGANKKQSYQELLNNIHAILKDKYSQRPQLSSSHPMDTNATTFIC